MDRRSFIYNAALGYLLLNSHPNPLFAETRKASGLVLDDIYLKHSLGKQHPESAQRLNAIKKIIHQFKLSNVLEKIPLLEDVLIWISMVHTQTHIQSLQQRFPAYHQAAYAVVQGVVAATHAVGSGYVRNAFCATRPPGHHAKNSGREEGFCFYNSVAIAARYAQKTFGFEKILIVDWDYHHGNGTESVFYSDPSVLFFSSHDLYAYPGTGDPNKKGEGAGYGFNINVHLPCACTNQQIITVYQQQLIPAAKRFKPDMILISAGFDSRKDDLLGCFNVTDDGFVTLTKIVMQLANEYCDGRIVSVLEGGYNIQGNASAVKAHINTLLSRNSF